MGNVSDFQGCTSENTKPNSFMSHSLEILKQKYQIDAPKGSFREANYSNFMIRQLHSEGDQQFGLIYKEGLLLYYGPIKNQRAEGKDGIMICRYRSGNQLKNSINQYKGQFKQNRANGRGILRNNQIEFDGRWTQGIPKSGTLKLLRENLELKIMEIKLDYLNNFESGYCDISLANKWRYKGDIKKNNAYFQFDGKGEISYATREGGGGLYVGQWKQGSYHGKGKYQWFDSNKEYEGSYYKGVRHGQGVQVFQVDNQTITFKGKWRHGKKDGAFTIDKETQFEGRKMTTRVNYKDGVIDQDFDN